MVLLIMGQLKVPTIVAGQFKVEGRITSVSDEVISHLSEIMISNLMYRDTIIAPHTSSYSTSNTNIF